MALARLSLALFMATSAVSLEVPAHGATWLATFMYACESEEPRPRLETRFVGPGHPSPRSDRAAVTVFQKGRSPGRAYRVIGQTRVVASSSRMGEAELTEWARREARRLGGDALLEVGLEDAAHATPPAGPVGVLVLDASIVRWE